MSHSEYELGPSPCDEYSIVKGEVRWRVHPRCLHNDWCGEHDSACDAYSKWLINGKVKVELRGKRIKKILDVELGHGNCKEDK